MAEISKDRIERVLKGLPPNDRSDGYPAQTLVSVAWLRDILSEVLDRRAAGGEAVAYLKQWTTGSDHCVRVDLRPSVEPWLAECSPTISPLYLHPSNNKQGE